MSDLLLELAQVALPSDAVADFCQGVISRHSENWPITEEVLADEFLAFGGLHSLPSFEEISRTCQDRLKISVAQIPLPDGMRGYNGSYGKMREILVSTKQDFHAAKLHTLLHELREILEVGFEALDHPIVNGTNSDLERRAEGFAVAVQVRAAHTALPVFLETASAIERKWLRITAYVFCFAFALAYVISCSSVQQIEDAFAQQHR